MSGDMPRLAALALELLVTAAPVTLWLMLLDRRDRREERLLGLAAIVLGGEELRGLVAVHVRCGVLGPGGLVVVDMRACTRDQVWAAIERLARVVPPRVRLRVESAVAPRVPATFSVQIVGRRPRTCPPSRVTAAT